MRLLGVIFAICPLFGGSFEGIVAEAMAKNTKIKALQEEIAQLQDQSNLALKWENPLINLGYNALYPLNPTYRKDGMQSISIGVSQKFDLFAKKPIEHQKILLQKQIKILELEALKKEIIKNIKIKMIKNYQDKSRLEVLHSMLDYILLFKKQMDFAASHFALDEFYKLEILETKIKLRLSQITQSQRDQILELQEYSFAEEMDIEFKHVFQTRWERDYYKQSYVLKIQALKEQINASEITLAKRAFLGDPTLGLGYFYRENNENFLSFTLSFPLPLYGREGLGLQSAQKQARITHNLTLSLENEVKGKIRRLENTLENKQKELTLIEYNLIPRAQKLTDLYLQNLSTSKTALNSYYQAFNDLLEAQLLKIDVFGGILLAYAELESMGGE